MHRFRFRRPLASQSVSRLANRALAAIACLAVLSAIACADREPSAPEAPLKGEESQARLRSLPYGGWVPVAEGDVREGVLTHDPGLAWAGENLFNPRRLARAFLLDMDGTVLRRWQHPDRNRRGFHHLEPLDDGGLLVLFKDHSIVRLDADSREIWSRELPVHHDVSLAGDGLDDGFWVATRRARWVERGGEELPIFEDRLTRLTVDGDAVEHLDLFALFGDRVPTRRWRDIDGWSRSHRGDRDAMREAMRNDTPPDIFHTNSIERLDRDVPHLGRRGDLLVSLRELDLVAVVDPVRRRVVWSWGPGEIERQHQPSITPEGTVLLFDNGLPQRGFSRVVEVDPGTAEIVWQYRGSPPESFYSETRGSAQRLPNGNTLITESDAGRVIEVTPSGEIAWQFLAPLRTAAGESPERAAIARMRRLPPGWTAARTAPSPADEASPAGSVQSPATTGG